MRIAVVAPIAVPVLPDTGHSIEQLVSLLTEELVRRGHAVTLFATGDSRTSAKLAFRYELGCERDPELWDWQFHEIMHAAAAFERAGEFDVIHSHAYRAALPFARLVGTPTLHTYHVDVDPDILRAFQQVQRPGLLAVSEAQRRRMHGVGPVPVVRHGIDTAAFEVGAGRGGYLLFLGQVVERKGPLEAIEIARRAGMPLVIAGPGSEYFAWMVQPHVDGEQVRYVGPVAPAQRNELLAGAAALLYPLRAPEPFGLVLIEAMAAGTPVLATAVGAVPEIVEPGLTGFHSEDPGDLADLVPAALALDRGRVRAAAVERWDFRRMVDDYERVYAQAAGDLQVRVA